MTSLPLLRPPRLRKSSRVVILSPAGPVQSSSLELGLETLRAWGLEPELHDQALSRESARGYFAGDDALRLSALLGAIRNPDIGAILCTRGGYGAMRLLPHLDIETLRASPTLLIGFSDITALHLHIAGTARVATLHGPVLKSFGLYKEDPSDSLGHLRAALFGEREGFTIDGLECVNEGVATGALYGGNASIVQALLSSPYCPDLSGAILFLEDVTEPDYRLDRLLTSIRLANKTARLGGLVLGDFTKCGGVYLDDDAIPGLVRDLGAAFDCPVVTNFPTGHGSRNVALPIGAQATLDASAGTLHIHQDATS